jgi:hypothetical protein
MQFFATRQSDIFVADFGGTDVRWRLVVGLSAMVLLSTLGMGCSTGGSAPSVPIEIVNADRLGGIYISFQYDSSVLEVTKVKQGALALATSRTIRWASPKAGEMEVLMDSGEGISGDGTLLVMKCNVLNSAGVSKLLIQVKEARSMETNELLDAQVSEGSFSAGGKSIVAPVITFGA